MTRVLYSIAYDRSKLDANWIIAYSVNQSGEVVKVFDGDSSWSEIVDRNYDTLSDYMQSKLHPGEHCIEVGKDGYSENKEEIEQAFQLLKSHLHILDPDYNIHTLQCSS